jgi:hypothetical protein
MNRLKYSESDLQIGQAGQVTRTGKIYTHTHQVQFGRPLSTAERNLFVTVIDGFYYTVHFSRQFGDGLVALPVVEFESENVARYTLKQTQMTGLWKDLLLTILANFSREVVPILQHDDSRIFDPALVQA